MGGRGTIYDAQSLLSWNRRLKYIAAHRPGLKRRRSAVPLMMKPEDFVRTPSLELSLLDDYEIAWEMPFNFYVNAANNESDDN